MLSLLIFLILTCGLSFELVSCYSSRTRCPDNTVDRQTLLKYVSRYEPCPAVIKRFSCSTQLSMIFSLLIDMKMPIIADIFIFINSAMLGKKEFALVSNLEYKQDKFQAQLSRA